MENVFYRVNVKGRYAQVVETSNPNDWTDQDLNDWLDKVRQYDYNVYIDENSYVHL